MSSAGKCRECGAVIPAGLPGGLCGRCLFALGLGQGKEQKAEVGGQKSEDQAGGLRGAGGGASVQGPKAQDPGELGRDDAVGAPAPLTEKPGDRIGRYTLLERIGEGGFGVVYAAEQTEPPKRRVALKIIKLGMDTRQVIGRFQTEWQALALMDHPHIAKVLDAGATDTGRPYFVMELVQGIPITQYCDQNQVPPVGRLELFIQVCRAIQHAHQKGIIHRDLKPSNILVSRQDGVPVPKVIDFGIAKATQGELAGKTVYTRFQQFLGTPAYMSPEQAGLSGLDVDTRSDIYALGVLLYELLVGRTPFEEKELLEAGLEHMQQAIREKEPVRPSTRLGTMVGEELKSTAQRRGMDAGRLISLLRGDLDWIVMKCLEKDRTRRYETANGLVRDVERHLNNEAVVAGPPSRMYRFRKLVRRHKMAVATAGVVFAALAIGLGVSLWSLRQANREASRSRQVAQFLKDMLKGVGPSVARGQDTTMLRGILDRTVQRLDKELKGQPDIEADLRTTIGTVYFDLGQFKKAETTFREALALRKKLLGNEHLDVASSLNNVANAVWQQGRLTEAESLHREALAMRKRLLGSEHADIASSLNNVGSALLDQGKFAEAETLYRQALAMRKKLLGSENPTVANSLNNVGNALYKQGKFAEAEALYREALAIKKKLLGSEHPDVANALNNLGAVLEEQGKFAEAETTHREALALRRKLLGSEHPDIAKSLNNLAVVLKDQARFAEAEALYREALAMRKKLLGNEHPEVASSLNNLAVVLVYQRKFVEAETIYREALALREKLLGSEHPDVANLLNNLGAVLEDQGKFAEAENLHREALTMRKKLLGSEHPDIARSLNNLAVVREDQGNFVEAEALFRKALTMRKKVLGSEHPDVAASLNNLAMVLEAQGKFTEAETLYREALAMRTKLLGSEHSDIAGLLNNLAVVLRDQGRFAEAEPLHRQALAMQEKLLGSQHPDVAKTQAELARTLLWEEKSVEAETVVRECLALREQGLPNNWENFEARALLGGTLVAQQKYAEAEPLLLSGYGGMKEREEKMPAAKKRQFKDVLQNLVRLYEATGKTAKAERWRRELTGTGA
jgi:serine/threonine protein kinase/tetratricopeptide (TPR) repeat protein